MKTTSTSRAALRPFHSYPRPHPSEMGKVPQDRRTGPDDCLAGVAFAVEVAYLEDVRR